MLSATPDVYLRIVKKSDGTEAYTRTIHAGESNISLPSYITNNNSDVTNTLTYTGANGTDPGNVTFSLVHNLSTKTLKFVIPTTTQVTKMKINQTFKLLLFSAAYS